MNATPDLPSNITVIERGWLSSNCIVVRGSARNALIDSGYCTHSTQTLALIQRCLGSAPLDELINTHLHSDHCGGNAALQARYPAVRTRIPPGQAQAVRQWDAVALSYAPTGQQCPRFRLDDVVEAGQELTLGEQLWQVHGAPGHDPHAVMLFEPQAGILISGDALWEHGFGVVFPELEGTQAFDEVRASLHVIEALEPRVVIPGHGKPFAHVAQSLTAARHRLDAFVAQPQKHAWYAAKVLLKFKLLEMQTLTMSELEAWIQATPYFGLVHSRYFRSTEFSLWQQELVRLLEHSGAACRQGDMLHNS